MHVDRCQSNWKQTEKVTRFTNKKRHIGRLLHQIRISKQSFWWGSWWCSRILLNLVCSYKHKQTECSFCQDFRFFLCAWSIITHHQWSNNSGENITFSFWEGGTIVAANWVKHICLHIYMIRSKQASLNKYLSGLLVCLFVYFSSRAKGDFPQVYIYLFIFKCFFDWSVSTPFVFDLRKETGVHRENSSMHRADMQTPPRMAPWQGFEPAIYSLKGGRSNNCTTMLPTDETNLYIWYIIYKGMCSYMDR